jgi:uncharacterized membrane protein YvlD (DUF360 family)
MYYLKAFFYNLILVFFANYLLPGIDVVSHTKIPHIGGDLIFALGLGLINSLIFPFLKVSHHATYVKMAGLIVVVNFIAYALLKLLPVGIHVTSFTGYFAAAIWVSVGSFLTNFFEMKRSKGSASQPFAASSEFHQMMPK